MTDITHEDCVARDAADILAPMRDRFVLPPGVIYLDGNSLGALPKTTAPRLADIVGREWGQDLIRSWTVNGWIDAPARLGGKIAPLIGARAAEVVVADSTSINLFKLIAGALSLRPGRRTILTESGNFPTDLYMMQGMRDLLGDIDLRVVPAEEMPAALDDNVALLLLTHVHYKSGRRWNMAELTRRAHVAGALVLWDLSHSVGALAIDLNGCDADLAVGCGYKYLNGGPGAPAFLFVAERHCPAIRSPLTGWMGHAAPFAFDDAYAPAPDLRKMLCGTPSILAMAALESGLDTMADIAIAKLEQKAGALGDLFIDLVEQSCAGLGLGLASPRAAVDRGAHVSFRHPHGYALMQALIARGVIGDFRDPDIVRFGFSPLYLSFCDIWNAVENLRDVILTGAFREAKFQARAIVT